MDLTCRSQEWDDKAWTIITQFFPRLFSNVKQFVPKTCFFLCQFKLGILRYPVWIAEFLTALVFFPSFFPSVSSFFLHRTGQPCSYTSQESAFEHIRGLQVGPMIALRSLLKRLMTESTRRTIQLVVVLKRVKMQNNKMDQAKMDRNLDTKISCLRKIYVLKIGPAWPVLTNEI